MSSGFPMVPLRQVLKHRSEFIEIDDFQTYKRCRVQSYAQGIVERDTVPGAEIRTKRQQVCYANEFLVAEIDAKVGGFGIVPKELEGALVSSHYFLFEVDDNKLERGFLEFYTRTPHFMEQVRAKGSTNYAAIRPNDVLGYEIPLPTLEEQHRIVARIEEVAAKIEEARGLRRETVREVEIMTKSTWKNILENITSSNWIPLKQLVKRIENGWSPACESYPALDDEWGVLKLGALSSGYFNDSENKALPTTIEPKQEYEVQAGDFLMSRANTTELVGACVLVRQTRPKLMLSDKIFRFKFFESVQIDLKYLEYVLKSPNSRTQIELHATGTSSSMKNISKEDTLNLKIPDCSPEEQLRIVAYLNSLQFKIDTIKLHQAETSTNLDALLPSILDKAFKGEL